MENPADGTIRPPRIPESGCWLPARPASMKAPHCFYCFLPLDETMTDLAAFSSVRADRRQEMMRRFRANRAAVMSVWIAVDVDTIWVPLVAECEKTSTAGRIRVPRLPQLDISRLSCSPEAALLIHSS